MYTDYLKIESGRKNDKKELELGINYGYRDRVAAVFDFRHSMPQNVTGYKLSLDIENTDKATLCELEKLISSENKIINAIISLDGIISKGKAKIAQMFSFDGVSYDVEITN